MNLYAIVLNEPNEQSWAKLKEEWPEQHYVLTERIAFLVAGNGSTTTRSIGDQLGMNNEKAVTGIVVHSAAINGWNRADLWEWVRNVSE